MTPAARLCAGDLVHGGVEGQAEGLDVEVNGIAGEVAFRPAPDETSRLTLCEKMPGKIPDPLHSEN